MEKGSIICNACRKKCDKATCDCGSERFLVDLYWKGKHEAFRRNGKGETLSRKEAEDLLIDINKLIREGHFDAEQYRRTRKPFRDIFEEYIVYLQERLSKFAGSPGYYRNVVGYAKNYYYVLDDYSIFDVRGAEISKVWDVVMKGTFFKTIESEKIELPIRTKTKKNIMDCLHAFYHRWLKKQPWAESIVVPPFPEIDEWDDEKERIAVNDEVQRKILENLREARCTSRRPDVTGLPCGHADIYEFIVETGIRECEVCVIKVKNIFPDKGDFWMDQHMVKFSGKGWVVWPGLKSSRKKKKREDQKGRWAELTPRAAEIARQLMQGKHPEDYLFINPLTNAIYNPDTIYRAHRNHGGTVDITVHEVASHTFVTNVMESGVSTQDAVLLTGKSEATLRRYNHPRRKKLGEVMKTYLKRKVVPIDRGHRNEIETKNGVGK